MNVDLLKRLCESAGVSGSEHEVREIILKEITPFVDEVKVDNIGNIIALKRGKKRATQRLMVSAHMDEVGFIVTFVTDEGFLKFSAVGGVSPKAVIGKSVLVGEKKIPGIVGAKPIHLLDEKERAKSVDISEMYIDIGAKSKEDALKHVGLGDKISFDCEFKCNDEIIMAKALDDRAGCFVLVNLIKQELPYNAYFTFVVQEEVGLRGAKVAAFVVDPECAVVVESTTATDILGVSEGESVCRVGDGAVVSFMDKSTIYCKDYVNLAFEIGKENDIKVQSKRAVAGGNDSGAIHVSRCGVKTIAVSLPCRYLHTAVGMISCSDLEATESLVYNLIERIAGSKI